MTSPDWVRAIFVRDPVERFVSAYLDRGRDQGFLESKCCIEDNNNNNNNPKTPSIRRQQLLSTTAKLACVQQAMSSPQSFLTVLQQRPTTCGHDPHVRPQSQRMTYKYWRQVNFVGRYQHLERDARALFELLGLWNSPLIQSGWGPHGTERIFSQNATVGRSHGKGARQRTKGLLTEDLRAELREYYREDYRHAILNFTQSSMTTTND
mmetsp:Transcript_652/g.1238  ORF Transcript_652/g.1238 Transcript_652/m.1238 type:complete len:208 (+) Transcript_652:1-624(+)